MNTAGKQKDLSSYSLPKKLPIKRNINYIIISSIIALTATIILSLVFTFDTPLLLTFIIILVLASAFFINKYWNQNLAVAIIFLCTLASIWGASLISNLGIRDVVILIYPLVIVFAGLLVNQRTFLFFSATAILSFNLFGFLELHGIIYSDLASHLYLKTLLNADITLIITTLCVWLITRDLQQSNVKISQSSIEIDQVNKRLESLIHSTPLAIITIDPNDVVQTWNPAAERMFGWQANAVLNKPLPIPDEFGDDFIKIKKLIIESGQTVNREIELRRKDSSKFYANITITMTNGLPEETGKILIIAEDITEKKKNIEDLVNSNKKAEMLTNAGFEGLVIIENETIRNCNNQLAKMLGYDKEEVINKPVINFVDSEFREIVHDAIRNNRQEPYESRMIKKDGTKILVEVRDKAEKIDGKQLRVTSIRDITETKKNLIKNEILFEISNAIVSSNESKELFEKIRQNLGRIIPVNNFYIALYDKETNLISFPYFVDQYDTQPSERPLKKGLTEYVLRTGKPLLADKKTLEELSKKREIELYGTASQEWVGIPLIQNGEIIGIMAAQIYNDYEKFDAKSLDVMSFTSNQVASAITKKIAEEKLAVQLDFLNSLLNYFPHNIYIKDLESRFINVSNKYLTEYRIKSLKDIQGKTDFDLFDYVHAKSAYDDEQNMIKTGIPFVGKEERKITPDGRVKYLISSKAPWHNSKGEVKGTFGISFDITDRKNAEIERDRFFTIALEMLCIAGTDGYFKRVNPSFERILGYTTEELLSKPFIELVHPDDRQATLDAIKQISDQKPVIDFENRYLCKDGTYKWLLWFAAPFGDIMYAAAHDITGRKKTEEMLASQLDFSNSLLELFPHKIYIKDLNSKFIAVSKKYLQEYGHNSPEDIVGKTDFDIFNYEHAKQAYEDEQNIIKTGQPIVGKEEKEVWPDGSVKYVITTKAPWHNSKGEIIGSFGISFDITDRKNAEIERDRFFTIALEMLCIAGTDGYFKRINPSFERILGYTTQELLSKPFIEFVHPDDRQSTLEAIQSLSDQKPVIDFENRYLCKDGTYKWILWIAAPFGDIMYSAAHDITERKKSEEILAIEKRRLADILSGTNVGTWEWNIQTGELTINERCADMLGYTLEELSPITIETWNRLTHKEDLEASYYVLEKHFNGESEYYECEVRMQHKNGDWIWILDRGKVAIRDKENEPLMMSGTHLDITERKRHEQILVESEKKLRDLNATKDKFFSIIAHDLRSPFQGILGILDYMIDEFQTIGADEILANMQRLRKGLKTQLNLLEDLLHWGRLQSHNAKFEPKLDDLSDVIRDSALFMSSLLSNKNIKLNIDIPENCPAYFDVNMISVVFRNLFSNAIKFSRPNSKIEAKLFQNEKEIIVTVRDYGVGMSKDNLDRLFKIEKTFSTFGTLNESGSGLGLILCYEIINKHNGRIEVESVENQGTIFKIILKKIF